MVDFSSIILHPRKGEMSYQVLARKWRPQTFSEVIGQDHIVRSLANQIKTKSLGHAFLFSGTRGVGKTSMARILAKSVRCKSIIDNINPCNKCSCCEDTLSDSSMDVIEVDGASNNSVDNIREIIESSKFLPVMGDKRVFIIDEVHMLSSSAFNALLKTLEEPPAHVVFIFATTEPGKLPATVLSRCQKYDFLEISLGSLVDQVKKIAEAEEINFESEQVIQKICQHGDGSVRDTLTLLEQALMYSTEKRIDSELIEKSLGIIKEETVELILDKVLSGDQESLKKEFNKIKNSSVKIDTFVLEFGKSLHSLIMSSSVNGALGFDVNLNNSSIATTNAELMWIFDIFTKDASDALDGVFALMSVEVLLLKLCLRKEILKNVGVKPKGVVEVKVTDDHEALSKQVAPTKVMESREATNELRNSNIVEGNSDLKGTHVETKIESENEQKIAAGESDEQTLNNDFGGEEQVVANDKNWEGFLESLSKISPATASNLEQGNIIDSIKFIAFEKLQVLLGFSSESEVFYDYLSEKNSRVKIVSELSRYFDLDEDKIEFELCLLEDKEKERIGFSSIVEIDEMNKEEVKNQKKEELLANELIKEAQGLFNSEIDKTIIQ
jgi:DNA polymerase III subunit gamma/tau